jgi:hypothetical protein
MALGISLSRCRAGAVRTGTIQLLRHCPTRWREPARKADFSGELKLGSTDRVVIERLLRRLQIPVESQLLVFSRTSFQRERIRPEHPRALYFNDHCYVGWVPGGLVEITMLDPVLGPIFYTFAPAAVQTNAARCFIREPDCLRCHEAPSFAESPACSRVRFFPTSKATRLCGSIRK